MEVVAPGKIFLLGEYAVLAGGTAIVAAVDRHARVLPARRGHPSSPVVRGVLASARRRGLSPPPPFRVDTSVFFDRGRKLGLGSSAAVAAGVAGWCLRHAGRDPARSADRRLLFEIAREGHAASQGGLGSGADVALSVWGGIRPCRRGVPPGPPLDLPRGLSLVAAWSGTSSATPPRVERFLARRASAAPLLTGMRRLVREALAALRRGSIPRFLDAVVLYRGFLELLGERLDFPIVTEADRRMAVVAAMNGGAAKPSGAGGGDLSIAFFPSARVGAAKRELARAGLRLLPLRMEPRGVEVRA